MSRTSKGYAPQSYAPQGGMGGGFSRFAQSGVFPRFAPPQQAAPQAGMGGGFSRFAQGGVFPRFAPPPASPPAPLPAAPLPMQPGQNPDGTWQTIQGGLMDGWRATRAGRAALGVERGTLMPATPAPPPPPEPPPAGPSNYPPQPSSPYSQGFSAPTNNAEYLHSIRASDSAYSDPRKSAAPLPGQLYAGGSPGFDFTGGVPQVPSFDPAMREEQGAAPIPQGGLLGQIAQQQFPQFPQEGLFGQPPSPYPSFFGFGF